MTPTQTKLLIHAIKSLAYGMSIAVLIIFFAFVIGFAIHFTIAAFWGGWNFYNHGK